MSKTTLFSFLVLALLAVSCKPVTPSQYIQPGEMEDILVDYHMARAMAQRESNREYNQALYEEAVFKKHGVTRADFDSSLVYYYTRADRFNAVCQRVADRLEEQALVLGATEGDIGKYATLNTEGDTANIRADRTTMILMPQPPYHRWEFSIEGDSTFRKGDSFLLQFISNYMYQSGNKTGVVYLAIEYEDTTIARYQSFSSAGISQLNFPEHAGKEIKQIRGFFYIDGGREETTVVRLLCLSNVQLIRFHNPKNDEQDEKNSSTLDSITRPLYIDSLGGRDTIRRGKPYLPINNGTTPNRVVTRMPEPKL